MSRTQGTRRFDVLGAIRRNERASFHELCEATGIKSTSVIFYYLQQLEKEGLIYRVAGARGIFIGRRPAGLPLPKERGKRQRKMTSKEQRGGWAGRGANAF